MLLAACRQPPPPPLTHTHSRVLPPPACLPACLPATPSQERFQSLGQAFYRGADACVLVYDVQSVATFDKLEALREQFIRGADVADPADFPFIVLGNKVDVDAKRHAVDQNKVKAWCESKGNIPHFLVRRLRARGARRAPARSALSRRPPFPHPHLLPRSTRRRR